MDLTTGQQAALDNSYTPGGINLGTKLAADEVRLAALETDDVSVAADIAALQAAAPFRISKTIVAADLTAAAVSEEIDFDDDIPDGAIVLARYIDVVEEFNDGILVIATAVAADFGDGVDDDGYFDGEDVFTASGTGLRVVPGTAGSLLTAQAADVASGARTPSITFVSDVTVDTLDTGELVAHVIYSAAPLSSVVVIPI
jgi:hypothetical protein